MNLVVDLLATVQPTLELLGKLSGEVPPNQVNVVLWQSPDWLAVQDALRRALDTHPDVQDAVFRELGAIGAE